jgi:hypothetical protein
MTPGVGVAVAVGDGVGVDVGVSEGVTITDTVGDGVCGLVETGAHALATMSATRSLLTQLP